MKKTEMLKKNYEFKNVLSKGKYYSGSYIEAFIKPTENINYEKNLLGLAISVKTGKAVKRNHVKRLLRENYKLLEPVIKKGYQIVFLWKKKRPIEEANFVRIQKDMNIILEKAKLFEEKT